MHSRTSPLLPTLVLAAAVWPALALAGEPTCDISIAAVPYAITAQGHYCLTNNLTWSATSGDAIIITANSVILDLRGYKINGQSAGIGTTANGVHVVNQKFVTVRNGSIRGFFAGIQFDGPDNIDNTVEDIAADGNTKFGIVVGTGGTGLNANNRVRNCSVSNTGGSSVAMPSYSIGLWLGSDGSFALNNTVFNTSQGGGASYYGMILGPGGEAVGNQVVGDGNTGFIGNYCFAFNSGAIYRDNIATGCGVNYDGDEAFAVGTTNFP